MKKALKRERKALRTICKDARFFSADEDEKVGEIRGPSPLQNSRSPRKGHTLA